MKILKAILRTKGLEVQYQGEATPKEIGLYAQIYEMMNGQEAIVMPSGDEYCFGGLVDEAKGKELYYLMEQDPFMGCYIDQREEFDAAYDAGEYAPDYAFCLPASAVEILAEEGNQG